MTILIVLLMSQIPQNILKAVSQKSIPAISQKQQTYRTFPESLILKMQTQPSEIEKMYNNYGLAIKGIKMESLFIDSLANIRKYVGKKEKPSEYLKTLELAGLKADTIKGIIFKTRVETLNIGLKQFGYNLFNILFPRTISIPTVAPTDNYILGPGDEVDINIWGNMENNLNPIVDNSGNIFVSGYGNILVGGKTFKEARKTIINKLKTKFANIYVGVSLGRLRMITIHLVGEFYLPGNYTISPNSSILYALFQGGGPNKNGSLRNIKIISRSKKTRIIDLYQLMVSGKSLPPIQFNDGDIIFVPPIGKTAAIGGAVKRPGIYELKPNDNMKLLLKMSGGVLPTAYTKRIEIERVKGHKTKVVYDENFTSYEDFVKQENLIRIQDGDLIMIYPVNKIRKGYVSVSGNVMYPGEYKLDKNVHLFSLLKKAGIKRGTYMERGEILRYLTDSTRKIIGFPLQKILSDSTLDTFKLAEWDSIVLFPKDIVKSREFVNIYGAVNNAGTYTLTPGLTLGDLLFTAVPQAGANLQNCELIRKKGEKFVIKKVDLTKDQNLKIPLKFRDNLIIKGEALFPRNVVITGEIKFPGQYILRTNETLKSLIERAGGLLEDAYIEGIVLTRKTVKELQGEAMQDLLTNARKSVLNQQSILLSERGTAAELQSKQSILNQQLQLIQSLSTENVTGRVAIPFRQLKNLNITLEDGDSLYIPKIPSTVQVIGAVYNPAGFIFNEKLKVRDYIDLAGGLMPDANRKAIYVRRASGISVKRPRKLKRGDTVIVPRKTSAPRSLMDTIKDLALIAYEMGVAIASLNTLLKK